ncbi:MAG: hypothetical protein CSA24_00670 [Deltaproteobacteria bacterium]|nr:MAG: hypothetical protein CSA24_00670 [Deltaproteobacteria bacterium]
MKIVGFVLAMVFFVGLTGFALAASLTGWGLPGLLDKPVSIRQGSKSGRRGGVFLYFSTRRHRGGGYGHGK